MEASRFSGLVIDWRQDLILSFPICLTRAPLEFSPSSGYLGGSVDSAPGSFFKVCVCLLFLSQSCKTLTGKNFDLWLKDKSNFLKSVHMLST